eukprot:1071673-Prymnesium_polylepis.1
MPALRPQRGGDGGGDFDGERGSGEGAGTLQSPSEPFASEPAPEPARPRLTPFERPSSRRKAATAACACHVALALESPFRDRSSPPAAPRPQVLHRSTSLRRFTGWSMW